MTNLSMLSASVRVSLTSQLGQDDRLHNSRQQADISISSLQNVVFLKAVKQQRLKPEHVLEICTLALEEWGNKTSENQNSYKKKKKLKL